MTEFEVDDILSVEFPFSDLRIQKRRPGLMLLAGDLDLLLARVTTHSPRTAGDVPLGRWAEIGLPRPSTIRLTKLATIDLRLIHHKIGHLSPDDARAVSQAWQQLAASITTGLRK